MSTPHPIPHAFAAARILDLERERDLLRSMVETLSTRVAAQSEMLGRSAENRGASAERVKELEGSLGPFAAILVGNWDDGTLPADAVYPVPMGDLRRAARVLAGTSKAGQ